MNDLAQLVIDTGSTFRSSIVHSSKLPECDRRGCTLDAVDALVKTLSEVDSFIAANPGLKKDLRKRFRESLADLCALGPLWHRALIKPNGYPGDYVLLSHIYSNTPMANDPIGRELDRAFLSSPLAETVRQRKDSVVTLLSNTLEQTPDISRILNLACGGCSDVVELLNKFQDTGLSFICVDHDDEAIAYAAKALSHVERERVQFIRANVLRIKASTKEEFYEPFNVIYSVGLLDYIPDKLASLAMRNWWRMVSSGGNLLLTVKDKEKYNPVFYDWMADWVFIQRSEDEFRNLLVESLAVPNGQIRTYRDHTGTSVQCFIQKNA